MYISLALLWLCFEIVHGEIIRCPIGGMTNHILCNELNTECVMNKFYIRSLELQLVKNPKNRFEEFDILFKEEISITDSKKQLKPMMFKRYSPDLRYYEIFRKSLISNNTASIIERWDEALDIRTDTYMIKFHNQLVHSTKQPSSYEEYMVYIQSYYNAANILYFYQNYKMAFKVINEGLKYFETIKNILLTNDTDKNHNKNARMWSILLHALNLDIMNGMTDIPDEKKMETQEKISSGFNEFNEANYRSFPISAIIYVRRLFLDLDNANEKKIIIKSWLDNNKETISLENDALYEKYISMYKFLFTYISHPDSNTIFNDLLKAIERPVLNIEDRLLNYFAIESTLTEVTKYIKEHYEEFTRDPFNIFEDYVKNNNDLSDLRLTTIPKLRILYETSNLDLLKKLYYSLISNCEIINEKYLNLVHRSLLNVNTKASTYYTNKRNVEYAIQFLIVHIHYQSKIINGDKLPYDYTDVNRQIIKYNSNTYYLEELAKVYYGELNLLPNHFITIKWLIEYTGLLSGKKSGKWNDYSKKLVNMFDKAKELLKTEIDFMGTNNFKSDQHYLFLKAKYMSKVLLPLNDWETFNRLYEWKFAKPKFLCLSDVNQTFMFEQLTMLQADLNCPYINRIELLTILFRYHHKYTKDNDAMYSIIKEAISEPVITPEDRMRNLEAHELFSMFLMERNNMAIEKANNLDVNEAYDQFMRDPKLRKKTNSGL